MAESAFTFYRGSAAIMASDLAGTPTTGLTSQLCGDAHLSNFGSFGTPTREQIFDTNDFDETLPGPWEWDLKRLAASFVLAGRHNGLSAKDTRKITEKVVRVYREAMAELAAMNLTDIWYMLVETDRIRQGLKGGKTKKAAKEAMEKAMRKDSRHALERLAGKLLKSRLHVHYGKHGHEVPAEVLRNALDEVELRFHGLGHESMIYQAVRSREERLERILNGSS